MQIPKLPRLVKNSLDLAMNAATGGIPASTEPGPAKRPYDRAKEITQKASAKAAAVSGSLALPVGPLGMLTILPDLAFVWRIQTQMVVDIAAAFGHKGKVTQQQLMTCLFKHVTDTATKEYQKSVPIEMEQKSSLLIEVLDRVTNSQSRELSTRIGKQVGQVILQRAAKRTASRLMPLAGAAVVATYSALDTKEVARTAVELFSGEKLPPRHTKKDFPRPEEMFEAPGIKEIDPNSL